MKPYLARFGARPGRMTALAMVLVLAAVPAHAQDATKRIEKIEADFHRSSDTHLIQVPLPATPRIYLYLKDESTHITGSLKHRLARSLFLYALCNGWINEDTPIIEASSGSTAISEAYFARLIGLRFITVIARGTSPPPSSSAVTISPVAAFTSGGPPRKIVPCSFTMMVSSLIAGTYAPPAVQEPITTAICGMLRAESRAWL